jgi:hypothetical protein
LIVFSKIKSEKLAKRLHKNEPAAEAPKTDADASKPNADATKPNADATKPNADATKPNADATKTNPNITLGKIVSSPPYKVMSCDQVVEIEAGTLLDLNDFTKKGNGFFTISMYMVNQFQKRDGNFLEKSITLDRIISMPKIIQGAVSCIGFFDTGDKYISICPKDINTSNQILDAFSQFMKCRMGDSLRNTPASTVDNILKNSCLGLDVTFDLKQYAGDVNRAKAALQKAMNQALKNAAKNLKGVVSKEKEIPEEQKVIDGSAKTIPQ